MSKIGKKPIIIPQGIEAKTEGIFLKLKGKNGELSVKIMPYVKIELKDGIINVFPESNIRQAMINWGTMRSLINNAVIGVNEGFSKILEIEGVGYRAAMEGVNLVLNIGLSHLVKMSPLKGVQVSVDKNTIKIFGADKMVVGEMAAKIREMKKPEPYKGKGIKYQGEVIRRKEGKKAAGATQ